MNWETLLCLGDSITIGARSYLAYPEHAAHHLSAALQKEWNVVNCAVSGFSAIELCRHLDLQMPSLLAQKPDIATILIGTNDVKAGTDPEHYRVALRLILIKCRLLLRPNNLILMHLPEFVEGVKYPYTLHMNDDIQALNRIIDEEAARAGLRTMQLQLLPIDFFDGVHLNETGSASAGQQLANLILQDKKQTVNRSMPHTSTVASMAA